MLVMIGGIITWFIFDVVIPTKMADIEVLSKLVESSSELAPMILSLCCLVATIWALIQTYTLWQWSQGTIESCINCGAIVDQKYGRYGSYSQCIACGKKRSTYS